MCRMTLGNLPYFSLKPLKITHFLEKNASFKELQQTLDRNSKDFLENKLKNNEIVKALDQEVDFPINLPYFKGFGKDQAIARGFGRREAPFKGPFH